MTLEPWTITKLWPYAAIIACVISWAMLRLLNPRTWRDRASAGVFAAFIISLYAEMYGFPLTIYFLAGFLPLKVPLLYASGHLWSTLLGAGAIGATVETLAGYGIALVGALLIAKGWVKIYFSDGQLVDDGVYRLVRHPQYFGIFLVIIGGFIDWPTIPALVLAPVIVSMYTRLAHHEEKELTKRFGLGYSAYRARVPMFVPSLRGVLKYSSGCV